MIPKLKKDVARLERDLARLRPGAAINAAGSGALDMAGDKFLHATQEFQEAVFDPIQLGAMSASAVVSALLLRNLGAYTVILYRDAGGMEPVCRIRPGTAVLIQPDSTADYHGAAESGASLVEVCAIQV